MKIIKKIKLKTVEERLGKELKKNTISLGWDVAVRSTGISLIRTTEDFIVIESLDKITVPKDIIDKDALDLFIEQLDNYKEKIIQKYKIDVTVIEDCFFGKNVKTLKALARHSVLVYDRFKRISRMIDFEYPRQARKKVGFNSGKLKGIPLKKEIIKFINNIFGLELKMKDNDLSDSLVLSLVGLVKL